VCCLSRPRDLCHVENRTWGTLRAFSLAAASDAGAGTSSRVPCHLDVAELLTWTCYFGLGYQAIVFDALLTRVWLTLCTAAVSHCRAYAATLCAIAYFTTVILNISTKHPTTSLLRRLVREQFWSKLPIKLNSSTADIIRQRRACCGRWQQPEWGPGMLPQRATTKTLYDCLGLSMTVSSSSKPAIAPPYLVAWD
jgi:hypothetical protein